MAETIIDILFVDTSSLRRAGFRDPDFQKLLLRAKERTLRIVVSKIAWEEWRTQMRDKECRAVQEIREKFETLRARASGNRVLGRLSAPALALWDDSEIDGASSAAMAEYAAENRIEIVPIGSDHGDRAWSRYFGVKVEPPFNPAAKDRESRRKDIPDSWIFEAALDLVATGDRVAALCFDENLAAALGAIGVRVFREPQDVIGELERALPSPEGLPQADTQESTRSYDELNLALGQAQVSFRDHDRKVLGYVAYFGTLSKGQLFEELAKSGISPEIAQNVAERLVIGGLIQDTGHHYLVTDRQLARVASSAVEDDIIKLLAMESLSGL